MILYREERFVLAHKPAGLVMHPTSICSDTVSLLGYLRKEIGERIYPVHRLDRATSGVVLFARTSKDASVLSKSLNSGFFSKTYLAIVRGHLDGEGVIQKLLPSREQTKLVPALTRWRTLAKMEQPWPVRPYQTARYTLLELEAVTGRRHQLRQHLQKISHPIIGDRIYGDGCHNRVMHDQMGVRRLLLHALQLKFPHPDTGEIVAFKAPCDQEMQRILELFPNSGTLLEHLK